MGIESHHDGHGLTESIRIEADDIGPGGASHLYTFSIDGVEVGRIQFQKGARNEASSTPGVVEAALLAVIVDRMTSFNAGPFPSREGAIVKTKCEEAMHWLRARADERAKRGVLGKEQK